LEAAASVAAVANCALIALVWVACLFCSVTRDYTSVTIYFGVGLLLAVIAVTKGYNMRPDLAIMLWGFNIGLGLTLFGLLARIISTFPFAVRSISAPAGAPSRAPRPPRPTALRRMVGADGPPVPQQAGLLSPLRLP